MLQRTEAFITSETEDSMKPKSRQQCGLLFGIAHSSTETWPSNATRESKEYTQQSWVSHRNLDFLLLSNVMLASLWEIQPSLVWHFTKMNWQKIICLVSNYSLKMIALTYSTVR